MNSFEEIADTSLCPYGSAYRMRHAGIPELHIYAFYKSNGLIPCNSNLDKLSDKDLQEFHDLCEEYDEKINAPIDKSVNIIKYVLLSNEMIEENIRYGAVALISCFNDFIHRHSKTDYIQKYEMKTEIDYCMFSALKTIRVLQSTIKLYEEQLPECIYALGREIFENY